MRILAPIAAAILASCSPPPEPNANTSATRSLGGTGPVANEAAIGAPAPAHDDPVASNGAAADGAAARFVGRWAANPGLCREGAWRFEEKRLATAGEVSCAFDRVTHVADGYDIVARCLAEGVTAIETIRLRFDADERMRVESRTFRPITLGRCAG